MGKAERVEIYRRVSNVAQCKNVRRFGQNGMTCLLPLHP